RDPPPFHTPRSRSATPPATKFSLVLPWKVLKESTSEAVPQLQSSGGVLRIAAGDARVELHAEDREPEAEGHDAVVVPGKILAVADTQPDCVPRPELAADAEIARRLVETDRVVLGDVDIDRHGRG